MMQIAHNIQAHDFDMLAPSDWQQFHDDFEKHTANIGELNEWTQSAMPALHSQLLLSYEYQSALELASKQNIHHHNLVIPIFNDPFIRVNLVSITPEQSLPLHDHPNASGAALIISGKTHAIACDKLNHSDHHKQTSVMLSIVENKVLSTNETACFTPEQHNIHSFEALTERVVLLIIHTPPFTATQQSYFFTASPLQKNGSQILAQRVRAYAPKILVSTKETRGQ